VSHSLHRYGTADNLRNDFCIYARAARGINRDGCGDKLREVLSIYRSENVVNFGSSHAGKSYLSGLDPEEYAKTLDTSYGVIATFADASAVVGVLGKLKRADLGISIVVSGLIEEIRSIARAVGLKPHTALLSLGIRGKKKLLPSAEVLEVTTMCGHSLVSSKIVAELQDRVRRGTITPERAALRLARPCPCGIFNTRRAAELLSARSVKPEGPPKRDAAGAD